jgi:hypothetical protein
MKNSYSVLRFLSLSLLISLVLNLAGCGSDEKSTQTQVLPPTAKTTLELFSQRPPATQARNQPISFSFRQPVVGADKVGSSADAYISFKPAVAGKAQFASTTQIIFVPNEPLATGQAYSLSVKPDGLANIPKDAGDLVFNFKTMPLEMSVQVGGLEPVANQTQQMQLVGHIFTSDYIQSEQLEKVLQASAQKKPLAISWEHNANGTDHRFTVNAIPRESFGTDLVLSWDGKAAGIQGANAAGKKEIPVPSQQTFSITRIEPISDDGEGKAYINVTFSDPLDTTQDLTGLVQLSGVDLREPLAILGNRLMIYPKDSIPAGEHKLLLNPGIRAANASLGKLNERVEQNLTLDPPKPAVRFVGKGSILPDNQTMEIPIEARGVNAVQITAMEIYPDNIAQFLQVNGLNGDEQVERVGRYIWRKTIPLTAANPNQWNRYSIDASQLVKTKPGTMYRLELAVKRKHSTYPCTAGAAPSTSADEPLKNHEDQDSTEASGWDGVENYVAGTEDNFEYNWEKREDPCDETYYHDSEQTKASHNFIASNLGLIAKQDGNGKVHVIATDLRTAKPATDVELNLRNFQGQTLASAKTNGDGFADLDTPNTPFLLIAQQGTDRAYLKVNANTALETSQFDVGGETVKKGLKGYIYGERGVWRPGDDIHLTFVLQDKTKTLPANHPVTLQLFDPTGKLKQSLTNKQPTGELYTFTLKTDEKDPTGDWLVKAVLGSSTFDKSIKIETVRPNRLKVELDYGVPALKGYEPLPEAKLSAQWLHGGIASNLKADVTVRLKEKTTSFTRFADYMFDDPSRKLDSKDQQLLEGRLDAQGQLSFSKNFQPEQPASGLLSANFSSRVFEEGGGFSISKQEMDYYPYANYVGIKLPKGDAERNMLLTDTEHTVDIASLNADGQAVSLAQVEVTLYKIEWKWWWDKTADSAADYTDASKSTKLQQSVISTTNGKGQWKFQVKYPDWGRYLVRVCDLEGKHCASKPVYIDWPGWAGRAQEDGAGAATMLRFNSDKTSYKVGETAQIQLPESQAGRALLTVETSSQILEQRWLEFNGQRTQISLPITAAMAPNAYVSISLLQAHQGKQNDRPLRLYGILPIVVDDPNTQLTPSIKAAQEWKPESTQSFTVSEQNGRAMDYTVAVVDEGLLGLTRYEAPDLHKVFYRKEALGIKTWDLFDSVIGAYSGNLERMLAIGGSDEAQIDDAANKPKRFPPVVQFLGAFHLDAGQSREHSVSLPSYLGAVRVMVVAADNGAYGKAEQPVYVRQPLMMLSSLPRTLKTGETLQVPLTLFVSDPAIKSVDVKAEGTDAFSSVGSVVSVPFNQVGEKTATVQVKAGNKPMMGKLRFTASSGAQSSSHAVDIEIQAPNVPSIRTQTEAIEAGKAWQTNVKPFGLAGSNQTSLELSSVPNLNLEQHLDYLVNYPHGCLEQTTSAAFPQLYLPKLLALEPTRQQKVESNIKRAISRLGNFQASNGNLMYWPGSTEANDWASVYAGHFLTEAQKQGYNVPLGLMSAWQAYQIKQAQDWTNASAEDSSSTQAYRLYVLALAGKPQLGAMNRLRESGKANEQARWLLAAAYQQAGQSEAAQQTVQGLVATNVNAPESEQTFSQKLGQLGLQLESLLALQKPQDADLLVQQISQELGSSTTTPNTHDISWALLSVAHYLSNGQQAISADYTLDQGTALALNSAKPLLSQLISNADQAFNLTVSNKGTNKLYASVNQRGIAKAGDEQAESNGLRLQASLLDKAGTTVWSSESTNNTLSLQQGQDYTLDVVVSNTTEQPLKRLALSTLVPSGAEIVVADNTPEAETKPQAKASESNSSSTATEEAEGEGDDDSNNSGTTNAASNATTAASTETVSKAADNAGLTYQDVRDDRVLSYFDLAAKESKTIKVRMNAAFLGDYYFPAISAEVMYRPSIRARTAGLPVQIVKPNAATPEPTLTN